MGKFAEIYESTITEGLRLVKAHSSADGKKQAKVYRDHEWDEYRVKHYKDGKHLTKADYHTDDKHEALDHAHRHVNEGTLVLESDGNDHLEIRTSNKTHLTIHKDDAKYLKNMDHGEKRHAGAVIHSADDKSPGKLHKADATRDGDHIHLHDHHSGKHIATIHHSSVNESYELSEAVVPHSTIPTKDGGSVKMRNEHISKTRKLKDGEKHSEDGGMYANHNGTSHFVKAHREGDHVHLSDHKTGKHVTSVHYKDMYHHMKD